jgi:riboflavin kinase/FMN adenylyltransferase
MQHYRSLKDVQVKGAWLTIGSFDGIHLGHQEILRQLTRGAHAAGSPAVVLTFYPHPAVVLGKRKRAFYLTTPEEQAELLEALSIDLLITHPFDQDVASLSAQQFLNNLMDHLGLSQLWVGHDFAMGHNREGDVPALKRFGELHNFQVQVISPVTLEGEVVSSSRIRALLAEGSLAQANRLLGRPYRLSGTVVQGQGRGRTLGIPTANLAVSDERALLQTGVYVCRVRILDRWHGAVTNIGVRPTFGAEDETLTVETHLLDYDKDLYGQRLSLEFVERLRGEKRFSGPQALVEQIHADIAQARQRLS